MAKKSRKKAKAHAEEKSIAPKALETPKPAEEIIAVPKAPEDYETANAPVITLENAREIKVSAENPIILQRPDRTVKLVAIERTERGKGSLEEIVVCRGVVALLEDPLADGGIEYKIIGNSSACKGNYGGWVEIPEKNAKTASKPILERALTFSGKYIGRYFGQVVQIADLNESAYNTIIYGYIERAAREEIKHVAQILARLGDNYKYEGKFHSNYWALSAKLEILAEEMKRKPRISDKDWAEAAVKMSDQEIQGFPFAARIFKDCLDYAGGLNGADIAMNEITKYCSSDKLSGKEQFLDRETLDQISIEVYERLEKEYANKMRNLELDQRFFEAEK